jgi:predicted nucleotidyltransferase
MKKDYYKNIRLSDYEINAIIDLAKKIFGDNIRLWIFGSRADLKAKGEDIDIYIEVENYKDIFNKKLDFLVELDEKIGEQKVDLIIKPLNSNDLISKEAKQTGVRLI